MNEPATPQVPRRRRRWRVIRLDAALCPLRSSPFSGLGSRPECQANRYGWCGVKTGNWSLRTRRTTKVSARSRSRPPSWQPTPPSCPRHRLRIRILPALPGAFADLEPLRSSAHGPHRQSAARRVQAAGFHPADRVLPGRIQPRGRASLRPDVTITIDMDKLSESGWPPAARPSRLRSRPIPAAAAWPAAQTPRRCWPSG